MSAIGLLALLRDLFTMIVTMAVTTSHAADASYSSAASVHGLPSHV